MKKVRSKNPIWDLRRFGVTPDKWGARFFKMDSPRVCCTSMPKSGTHFLERLLCFHPRLYRAFVPTLRGGIPPKYDPVKMIERLRPGQMLASHLRYREEIQEALVHNTIKHLLIVRDPRDVIVSDYFFAKRLETHHAHKKICGCKDISEGLDMYIKGFYESGPSIGELINGYIEWMPKAHLVYFEDLRGSGQIKTTQRNTIKDIFEFLSLPISERWVDHVLENLVSSDSPTFRKGLSGEWKMHFSEYNKFMFKEIAGQQLITLGYESDLKW
jgi:hypothetical protein